MKTKLAVGLTCSLVIALSHQSAFAKRIADETEAGGIAFQPDPNVIPDVQHNIQLAPAAPVNNVYNPPTISQGITADPVSFQPATQPAVQPAVSVPTVGSIVNPPVGTALTPPTPSGGSNGNMPTSALVPGVASQAPLFTSEGPASSNAIAQNPDCLASAKAQIQVPQKMNVIMDECSNVSQGQSTYFYRTCMKQAAARLPSQTKEQLKVKLMLKAKLENTAHYCMHDSGNQISRMKDCMSGVVSQISAEPVAGCNVPVDQPATTADITPAPSMGRAPSSVGRPGSFRSAAAD